MHPIAPYAKAAVAFIVPGAVLIGSAVTEQSPGGAAITTAEWVTALVACIVTAGTVWGMPNAPKAGE